jgi:hypothetical protein
MVTRRGQLVKARLSGVEKLDDAVVYAFGNATALGFLSGLHRLK